ncbi:MAG: hypothetical protein GXP29_07535 [Planctomycetes bacterium]|nr:hypothetical protein [Planctomycetota bacterium]
MTEHSQTNYNLSMESKKPENARWKARFQKYAEVFTLEMAHVAFIFWVVVLFVYSILSIVRAVFFQK